MNGYVALKLVPLNSKASEEFAREVAMLQHPEILACVPELLYYRVDTEVCLQLFSS